jgi:hypothetical protein
VEVAHLVTGSALGTLADHVDPGDPCMALGVLHQPPNRYCLDPPAVVSLAIDETGHPAGRRCGDGDYAVFVASLTWSAHRGILADAAGSGATTRILTPTGRAPAGYRLTAGQFRGRRNR